MKSEEIKDELALYGLTYLSHTKYEDHYLVDCVGIFEN